VGGSCCGGGAGAGGAPCAGPPLPVAGSVEPPGEYQQKRRFVWTPDLHSRFESACNQLGLDNAKPKSILKLMDVDGLTKANIKSHLQKYRCMMQKRSASEASVGGSGGAPPAKVARRLPSAGGDDSSDSAAPRIVDAFDVTAAPSGPNGAADPSVVGVVRTATSGPLALQQNLEVQEGTLRAQMELQRQLSQQLQAQQRLQSEMEAMMQGRSGDEDDDAASVKMAALLRMKQKLQSELQGHLRMQHDLLTQLNQLVLPLGKSAESSSDDGNAADAESSAGAKEWAGVDADSEAETPRAAAAAAVAAAAYAVCAAAAPSTSLPVALPASVKME